MASTTDPNDPAPWLVFRARPLSALGAMPGPSARAGLLIMANPLIWVQSPGSDGLVVLKAMGVIVAAIA